MIQWTRLAELENFSDIGSRCSSHSWFRWSTRQLELEEELWRSGHSPFPFRTAATRAAPRPEPSLNKGYIKGIFGKREGKTSDRSRSNLKLIPIIWEIRDCITFLKWGWNRKREPSMAITTSWETYINVICRLQSIFLNQYKYKHLPLRIFLHHLVVHLLQQGCHASTSHHTCPPGNCFTDIPEQRDVNWTI